MTPIKPYTGRTYIQMRIENLETRLNRIHDKSRRKLTLKRILATRRKTIFDMVCEFAVAYLIISYGSDIEKKT